jgi:hypothetical protein
MKGSTLIETLVYIGLLSILMVGTFSSILVLIGQENPDKIQEIINQNLEANYHE